MYRKNSVRGKTHPAHGGPRTPGDTGEADTATDTGEDQSGVIAAVKGAECRIQGNVRDWNEGDDYYGNEYFVDGVAFTNFSVAGDVITALDDPSVNFNTNEYASGIVFNP